MNHLLRYIIGICLILTFCCCNKQITGETVTLSDLPLVNISADLDTIIEIKNWLAIGPFDFMPMFTDPVISFFRQDLKRYRIKEGSIDEVGLKKLQKRGAGVFLINEASPQIKLFKYVRRRISKKSNFYLVARIHSAKTQDAAFITDGSNSYSVWLNGDKLVELRGKYNVNKAGDRFVNVSLKEGENLVFVKINRGTNVRSWDLICAITPRQEAERIYRVNYASDFVVNPLINSSLEVYAGPYLSGRVEVINNMNQVVGGGSFDRLNTNDQPFIVSDLKKLEDGFYKTILLVGGARLEEMVYKGNFQTFVKQAKTSIDEIGGSNPYNNDLKAAMQRVNYLNEQPGDPNSPSETRFINRNRVYWGYSLYRMFHKDALTQLMTYESQEENSGIFIFHVGNQQQQNIPLVIVVPSALQGNSMIEDWYTSNLDQIETDNALADEYGFAVAWIYAGGRKYSANQTEKEIASVIKRVNSEYDIDHQRIFITGDCEGGRRALLQLAASPDRYAACVVSSPLTLSGGIDGVPINLLSNMGNIPILVRHGTDDDVSPIENSRKFYEEAQKINMAVEYIEVQGSHICVAKDLHRFVFDFFNQIDLKQK